MAKTQFSAPAIGVAPPHLLGVLRMPVALVGAAVTQWAGELTYLAGSLIGLCAAGCLPRTWSGTELRQQRSTLIEQAGLPVLPKELKDWAKGSPGK